MKKPASSAKAVHPNGPASTQDSFVNFQARIGYGTGNIADGGRYNFNFTSHNRLELEAMYRTSWICGKAVDTVAEDMTKRGIEVTSSMGPEQIDELMACWQDMQIWNRLADTIKWARLYGGALAVHLVDGQNMATELRPETIKKGQYKGLYVLDRWMVQANVNELVSDFGPHMGMPLYYTVVAGPMSMLNGKRIHYSRVIRIDGLDLPFQQRQTENLWGQSVLERLIDRLLAFDSTTQGAAQLVYKAHLRTYKVEGLRDIIAAGGTVLQGLIAQIDFMRSTQTNEGLTLMDTKDEFEAYTYTFAGLDSVLLQFSQQLSGALDIPLTRLFGQSPAGLNSTGESDTRNYYDGITQQQERRLRAGIMMTLRLSYSSLYGLPLPVGSNFMFRPLWQMSDIEKANLASVNTKTIQDAFVALLIGRKTALTELRQQSRITNVWTNIDDATIAAADDNVEPDELSGAGSLGGAPDLDHDDHSGADMP